MLSDASFQSPIAYVGWNYVPSIKIALAIIIFFVTINDEAVTTDVGLIDYGAHLFCVLVVARR